MATAGFYSQKKKNPTRLPGCWVLTGLQQLVGHVPQRRHLLLLGGVDDQQDAPQQAQQAAQLAQDVQRLPQQVGGQNRAERGRERQRPG